MRRTGSLSRTVLKATGIFGGTQAVSLIGSVIRTKLIAIWIGEAGIGLFGLFNTAVDLIGALTQLSVRSSSVRDVSELAARHERTLLRRMVATVRRWGWALGLLGAAVMAALSPLLALTAFGDASVVWPFMVLSLAVLLNSASEAEKAVLQGLRDLGPLARSMTWAVVAGCLVSVPMIYFWREGSVAPVILAYSAVTFAVTWLCRARFEEKAPRMSVRETFDAGRRFARLGLYMTLSSVSAYGAGYLFMTYMNLTAGTSTVGVWQAGYTLTVKYAGFLFAAIGVEYYPRLASAAVCGNRRLQTFMRHEMRLLLMMIAPLAALLATFAPLAVTILYSSDFASSAVMVQLACTSLVFRAASWCVAFVILAKGDGPAYFFCELASAVVGLALNVAGFALWGVEGVGASLTVWYVVYFALVTVTVRRRYGIGTGSPLLWLVAAAGACVAVVSALAVMWGTGAALLGALLVGLLSLFLFLGRRRR